MEKNMPVMLPLAVENAMLLGMCTVAEMIGGMLSTGQKMNSEMQQKITNKMKTDIVNKTKNSTDVTNITKNITNNVLKNLTSNKCNFQSSAENHLLLSGSMFRLQHHDVDSWPKLFHIY